MCYYIAIRRLMILEKIAGLIGMLPPNVWSFYACQYKKGLPHVLDLDAARY